MRHSIAAVPQTTARFVTPVLLLLGLALPAAPALSSDGAPPSRLLASTLLGGVAADEVNDMAVGPAGTVYVAGWTESADFPVTPGAFDLGYAIALDPAGGVFVTGLTIGTTSRPPRGPTTAPAVPSRTSSHLGSRPRARPAHLLVAAGWR